MAKEPNLKQIIGEGSNFDSLSRIKENQDISEQAHMFISGYVAKNYGEEEALAMNEVLRKDPLQIRDMINDAKSIHARNLTGLVEKNPYQVISNINEKYLVGFASGFFDKDNVYRELEDAIKNNGDVRGAMATMFGGEELWKSVVARTPQDILNQVAGNYINTENQKQIIKNLTKDGKVDIAKTSKYIAENISKQGDEERQNYYVQLGVYASRTESEKAKE